jgi:putative ABC transport system substrate-binding protein
MTYAGIDGARRASNTVPIVMVAISDPVKLGLVASLSRPGGNITGLSNLSGDVSAKYLELLRAAVPGLSSIAVWLNPENPSWQLFLAQIKTAAANSGVKVLPVEVRSRIEIEAGFAVVKRERARAIIVTPNALFSAHSPFIAQLAIKHRLPTMFWTREHVEAGGLMSYGQNNAEHYYRAASYVDKILKGAKPGDLPIEQATRIELVINRKTAKALGLTIPQSLLIRADTVID